MDDIIKIINDLEREKVKNNLSKKESKDKVLKLNNELSIVSNEIRKMEKFFCSVDFKLPMKDYEDINSEEEYLVMYDKKLKEEMLLIKDIAFYMQKC